MKDSTEGMIQTLTDILAKLGITDVVPHVSHPQQLDHGDYTTNVALIAGKKLGRNPMGIAEEIAQGVRVKGLGSNLEKIEVASPGFINFWLTPEYLVSQLNKVLVEVDLYGQTSKRKEEKIMIEFTDPNPFKEFHIGHLYSNTIGEAIARLLKACGARVWRVNYQGDVGMHVAKSLWGLLQISRLPKPATGGQANLKSPHSVKTSRGKQISNLEKKPIAERAKFLGEAYAMGAKAFEEDQKAKAAIIELNKKIYEKSDPEINLLYEKGRAWSLAHFEQIYKRLGTTFDRLYFESDVGEAGVALVKEFLKKGVFVESEGAIIFPGEKYTLHNRVFINSLGLPTYEAKELGLAARKYKDCPYDQSIIVTGNEIKEYFKVLLAALRQINPDLAAKTRHISHGMVRLPGGKMSSRLGNIISCEWLLNETKTRIAKEFSNIDKDVLEQITVGAVKYAMLKSGVGRDITFRFEESISFEGNSGPYLQYTYARTQSVLKKVSKAGKVPKIPKGDFPFDTFDTSEPFDTFQLKSEELQLLRIIYRFPEVVAEAAESFAPNLVCSYLFTLAQSFNLFYEKHKILGSEHEEFRLALTAAVGQILKNGLSLLGMQSPTKM